MVKKTVIVPDAWDDDWEAQADQAAQEDARTLATQSQSQESQQSGAPSNEPKLSKTQRRAQHEEANRKIWESAETESQTFHFLEANNAVPPLAQSFKPQVKVLSRKPVIAKRDPSTTSAAGAISNLSLADRGSSDEDEDPNQKQTQLTQEEIRAKQKRDREDKQRRYEEARAKIFGNTAPTPSSGASSPGTVTPPKSDGRSTPKGGRGRGGSNLRGVETRNFDTRRANNVAPANRELYDPGYAQRPDSATQRQNVPSRTGTPKEENQPIRAPRGPDGSGRGGFGFARRGTSTT